MKFEWDPAKHAKNLRERGIGLDEAALIFEGETINWPDTRADYGEARINALGEINGKVLRVAYTLRATLSESLQPGEQTAGIAEDGKNETSADDRGGDQGATGRASATIGRNCTEALRCYDGAGHPGSYGRGWI